MSKSKSKHFFTMVINPLLFGQDSSVAYFRQLNFDFCLVCKFKLNYMQFLARWTHIDTQRERDNLYHQLMTTKANESKKLESKKPHWRCTRAVLIIRTPNNLSLLFTRGFCWFQQCPTKKYRPLKTYTQRLKNCWFGRSIFSPQFKTERLCSSYSACACFFLRYPWK